MAKVKLLALTTVNKAAPGELIEVGEDEVDRLLKLGAARHPDGDEGQAESGPDGSGGGDDDTDERLTAIFAALVELPEDADRTSDGKPTVEALSDAVGFKVTAEERDAAVELASDDSDA